MPRFAANLSFLFTEVPYLDRYDAAAKAGFKGVETLFPYDHPAAEIATRLKATGLSKVLINLPPGDWEKGERGLTSLPGRQAEFRASVDKALEYAAALNCPKIHPVAGVMPAGADRPAYEATYRENLAYVADQAAKHGLMVTIEMINTTDIPGFFLSRLSQARAVLKDVNRPNLKFQFDTYHVQIMEGEVPENYRGHVPLIGHIQISSTPGRHEPDQGMPDHTQVFRAIDDSSYDGWVSCEYKPRAGTREGLGWAKPWGIG